MAANQPDPSRLISVQSHVVTGYVGNRSATFPLQLLGWDVDVVNTTQLSNHTGYGRFTGMRLDAAHLENIFAGLEQNGLLRHSRMLSGYTPSPAALTAVKTFVQKLKRINSKLIYLMDPVMGDMGRGFYVDQGCLPIYRDLLPYATIVCPNQFEAQALADKEITDLDSLAGVLQAIHQRGVPHVVITSVDLKESVLNLIGTSAKNGAMVLVGSSNEGQQRPWFIQSPEVEGYFSGVGDLFSALLVGRFQLQTSNSSQEKYEEGPKEGGAPDTDLSLAAEKAVAGLQGVLSKTSEAIAASEPLPTQAEREAAHIDDTQFRVEVMRRRELKVVQSRQAIETPVVQYKARWMS